MLATLDDADYKLGVEAIEIQYDQLKKEVDRMKLLYENNSISGNDYDKATSGLAQVAVQLQSNPEQNSITPDSMHRPVDIYKVSILKPQRWSMPAPRCLHCSTPDRWRLRSTFLPHSIHNRIESTALHAARYFRRRKRCPCIW